MQVLICLVAEEFKQILYLTLNSSFVKIVSLTDGLSAFECQRFHILTVSQHVRVSCIKQIGYCIGFIRLTFFPSV